MYWGLPFQADIASSLTFREEAHGVSHQHVPGTSLILGTPISGLLSHCIPEVPFFTSQHILAGWLSYFVRMSGITRGDLQLYGSGLSV